MFPKEAREAHTSAKTIGYVNKVPIISQTLNFSVSTTRIPLKILRGTYFYYHHWINEENQNLK